MTLAFLDDPVFRGVLAGTALYDEARTLYAQERRRTVVFKSSRSVRPWTVVFGACGCPTFHTAYAGLARYQAFNHACPTLEPLPAGVRVSGVRSRRGRR